MTRSAYVYHGLRNIQALLKPHVSPWDFFPYQLFVELMPFGAEVTGKADEFLASGVSSLTEVIESSNAAGLPIFFIADELERALQGGELVGAMTQAALKEALDAVCEMDSSDFSSFTDTHCFDCDGTIIDPWAPQYPSWPEYPFEE